MLLMLEFYCFYCIVLLCLGLSFIIYNDVQLQAMRSYINVHFVRNLIFNIGKTCESSRY